MSKLKSPIILFIITVIVIALLALFGPEEKSLGANVRIVYLHGAWVWTTLVGFATAALAGLLALISRRKLFYAWSQALGRTGLLFWITYLPLSLWAMQSNWNGLFLAEPRWRFALAFAVGGLLLQVGMAILDRDIITASGNIIFAFVMFYKFGGVENVMHPRSPIWESGIPNIQLFFVTLLGLTLVMGWQIAHLWLRSRDA